MSRLASTAVMISPETKDCTAGSEASGASVSTKLPVSISRSCAHAPTAAIGASTTPRTPSTARHSRWSVTSGSSHGWPGGPEEAGLRKAAEAYNATATDADKVKLIFFNRDGFFDKLAADLAAGSTDFDINLLATYALGRYAPFMDPITLPDASKATFPEKVLATMQYDGKQYGIPTDLSLHFMYYRSDLIEKLLSDADWSAWFAALPPRIGEAELAYADSDWLARRHDLMTFFTSLYLEADQATDERVRALKPPLVAALKTVP